MGATDPRGTPSARHTATVSNKPAGWRLVNFTRSTIQPHRGAQPPPAPGMPPPGWSDVHHDFQRRLTRRGIKVTEAKHGASFKTLNEPTAPPREGARAILDSYPEERTSKDGFSATGRNQDFPSLAPPTVASLTINKRESKLEDLEQQLRQACAEMQIWKEKCEVHERDLRVSYGETMKWRMEYEDLYSAIIRDQPIQPSKVPTKRHGTKSLG